MSNELFEKEFTNGVIEYDNRHICKISRIQITKLDFETEGIQHISMRKEYQNNDKTEHDEIDDDLINIYNNKDLFKVTCFDETMNYYFNCQFVEKPPKNNAILSAKIIK